ncbi:multiple sugar transport system permease protein/fructooligosaccharide transport system permease protein [Paenibacillus endophyticus]|uniref:Multiple sugar transport system permease protein/fructooligosaccharide transport system permease protein n=1 Tax=Paenibacillus endophyticus TaxID=1294268 RepID=A0A7W5CEU2_9BACL|nr:carbohydrate ABC transporter permease [Paenibacillus endophyticus]MBB3155584.1 multiple sugar transport system permease protein/fructooligosaccharide transport system permease protein [Paenibacillus endophyticus]
MSFKRTNLLLNIVNMLIALLFITPLLWMVVSSLKPENQIFADLSSIKSLIPINLTFDNYIDAFNRIPMMKYLSNSLFYVSIISISGLVVNSICGYALAKLEFKGKDVTLTVIIALLIVPFESILMPLYFIVNSLHWVDTWLAMIVPFVANCFSIFMFRQFFMDIPNEILESASIDGSTAMRSFASIVVPLSGPVFATVFILDFISHWGDFMWPILVTTGESMRNVQLGIQTFFTLPPIYYGQIMATLTFTTIPIIILFLFLQKYYVQGITSSGIKG